MDEDKQTAPECLTEPGFWDSVSATRLNCDEEARHPGRLKAAMRRWGEEYSLAMTIRLCAQRIPKGRAHKMLEVGCAPARVLCQFQDALGHIPYGLEYTSAGVQESRSVLAARGWDPNNIFHADLFDPAILASHAAGYDFVFSRGLIEHFSDPVSAVRCHAVLVKPGGYLLISIPKLVGFSLFSMWLMRREFIDQHNREIMHLGRFRSLFHDLGFQELYSGHVGFLTLYGLFTRRERSLRGRLARAADHVQTAFNLFQRVVFMGRNVTWPWSPALVFLGRKS